MSEKVKKLVQVFKSWQSVTGGDQANDQNGDSREVANQPPGEFEFQFWFHVGKMAR